MCITIFNADCQASYDVKVPLEDQIKNAKQIVVNYDPQDTSIDHFLDEIKRMSKTGAGAPFSLKFNNNNFLSGYRIEKQIHGYLIDIDINEAIKMMVSCHAEADKKLGEMADSCMRGKNNE